MAITKFSNMINPEVMSQMISAKVEQKISVIPFAKMDTTLQGQAGNTITNDGKTNTGIMAILTKGNELLNDPFSLIHFLLIYRLYSL